MLELGNRIKECRLYRNMSQRDLAIYLGVATQTVCNWEANTKTPDSKKLTDLSKLLQVSADYLLGRTDHKELPSLISIKNKTYTIQAEMNNFQLSNQNIAKLMNYLYSWGYEVNDLVDFLKKKT